MPPKPLLLVDDQQANLLGMSALLEPLGHPVVCARSGDEAIVCLERDEAALILLDVKMPGIDGFETLIRIRERSCWDHIPVVFLTAIHGEEQEARGYALGAVDYVARPIRNDLLVAKVRSLVSWHERTAELARERATREERERILGMVSHDLRTPLAVLRTGADYLVGSGLTAAQAQVARRVQRNADRMARLVNDLLDFTRLQAGGLMIRATPGRLGDLITESVEDIRVQSRRPIELAVETERTPPIDGDRVAQAVSNLVLNAVQHSPESSRVAVALRERGAVIELSVWNEGEIAATEAGTLFEPFRKGARSGGMGLGLYISQQIAKAHGGDITVTSLPGQGTTFRMTLPMSGSSYE
jgi:signal transduction histidine kinase